MPAASRSRAVGASYAVSAEIFLRPLREVMKGTVSAVSLKESLDVDASLS